MRSLGSFRKLRGAGPGLLLLLALAASGLYGADAPEIPVLPKKVDFEAQILPIFKRNCLACHNASDAEGELVLETPATISKGGKSGPVAEPKASLESLLLRTAAHLEKPFMPPKNNKVGAEALKAEELALLRTWIDQGATGTVKARPRPFQWQPLPPGLHPILAVAVSPDGQYAACGRANQIFIYHLPSGQIAARLTDPGLAEETGRSGYHSSAQHDFVQSLAFSPDGRLLASGEYRQVKLWQREPNLPQLTLGAEPASALAVSPDGKWIATAGADFVIRLWPAATGEPGPELRGHTGVVRSLRFSPDGMQLASGAADKTVRVWKTGDGQPFARAEAPQEVSALAWLLGGRELASAGGEAVIRRWQLPAEAGGALVAGPEIAGHTEAVTCLAAFPEGGQLLSGGRDRTIRQWVIDQAARQVRQVEAAGPVEALALAPSGKTYAAAAGAVVRLWKTENGQQLAEVKGDPRARTAAGAAERQLTFAQSEVASWKTALEAAEKARPAKAEAAQKASATLAAAEKAAVQKKAAVDSASDDKSKATAQDEARKADGTKAAAAVAVQAADAAAKAAEQTATEAKTASDQAATALGRATEALEKAREALAASEKPIHALAFSPDSLTLASAGDDQIINTWGAETGAGGDTFPGQLGAVTALAWSAQGRLISAAAQKGAVVWLPGPVWTLARTIGTGDEKSPLVGRASALAFSHDGQRLATGGGSPSRSGEVKIWRVSDGGLQREITPSHSDSVYSVDFSPDDRLLATASADKFVKIFAADSGQLVRTLSGHTHYVLGVSWRADGRLLASSGADKVVKLWSYPAGEQLKTVEGYGKEVTAVHFVGLGSELLTAAADPKVRLLKEDGGTVREYGGGTGFILTTAASADGQIILAGGQESILRVWNAATGKTLLTLDPPPPEVPVPTPSAAAR